MHIETIFILAIASISLGIWLINPVPFVKKRKAQIVEMKRESND